MVSDQQIEYFVTRVLESLSDDQRRSADITLHFFQSITRGSTLYYQWQAIGGRDANARIGRLIKDMLSRENLEIRSVGPDECEWIDSYTRFVPQ